MNFEIYFAEKPDQNPTNGEFKIFRCCFFNTGYNKIRPKSDYYKVRSEIVDDMKFSELNYINLISEIKRGT